jgi:hypothetical protein
MEIELLPGLGSDASKDSVIDTSGLPSIRTP